MVCLPYTYVDGEDELYEVEEQLVDQELEVVAKGEGEQAFDRAAWGILQSGRLSVS